MLGFPDILCCYKGRFIAIEVKTEKGHATKQQLKLLSDIREAGGVGILATGVFEVANLLEDIDNEHKTKAVSRANIE